jgi:phosphoribosylamine--glycine ligase
MNVLVIGGGGREHALAWKAAQSADVDTVYVAPGNAGTAREAGIENVAIDTMDFTALADFAEKTGVDLTIVGPEIPLVDGVVDYFQERNLRCFGPGKGAAQLEGSKAFTKAGKGVIVAETLTQAEAAVTDMLSGNAFGEAGCRVVIEEFLAGEEASFIVMVDGVHVLPMATSQDHKRIGERDTGPNTGGMGAYSPAPVVDAVVHQRVMDQVILPTVAGMAAEGNDYTGFLYAGLMIDAEGQPKVIEYNCRFGDPETQPIMMRLQSDLVALCNSALDGTLDQTDVQWDPRCAIGVVLAAGGYPGDYAKGSLIQGLDTVGGDAIKVFHAGTALRGQDIVTSGGRVLCVTALGEDIAAAQRACYAAVDNISWDSMTLRRDIGWRAVARYS